MLRIFLQLPLRWRLLMIVSFICGFANAQQTVDVTAFDKKSGASVTTAGTVTTVSWDAGEAQTGKIAIDMHPGQPLIHSLQLFTRGVDKTVASGLDPAVILTVGKRDLVSQNGWNIFFDRTAYLPSRGYPVILNKKGLKVSSSGSRTELTIGGAAAGPFSGSYVITLYAGSPLLNIAAVMRTNVDSLAVIYDCGLTSSAPVWSRLFWADTDNNIRDIGVHTTDTANIKAVKYRTIMGESGNGTLAVFPAPHQFFDPLDNCYNLEHIWYGANYRKMVPGYGIGLRHDLLGDRRWVPWFNAPPNTDQCFNFFCLLSTEKDGKALKDVKAFTHADTYLPLEGYYTMSSHFHQEHVDDVLTRRPLPELPGFVKAFRNTGVNIVHLGEFHGPGSPRGPEVKRWPELQTLFSECERLSDGNFLLLPGEEPNNFFGGHWMNLFPKPVYWLMSRQPDQPFVEEHPGYGKLYRIANKEEMLRLLELEKGLAWTAHARTKGSTGFPDKYKDEEFFKSDRFLGAAWKAMPADLSQPKLGNRVLDLMDDMANWGLKKYVIAEADLFRIEPDYELYGHLNVNYLKLPRLPRFSEGWQPVLDAMEKGEFFVSTGEVLLPEFKVNGVSSGGTARVDGRGNAKITFDAKWTFPLNYAEVISGDGKEVYRHKIDLHKTRAFGEQNFEVATSLKDRKWVRLEVWDVAANGAFTQIVWLQ